MKYQVVLATFAALAAALAAVPAAARPTRTLAAANPADFIDDWDDRWFGDTTSDDDASDDSRQNRTGARHWPGYETLRAAYNRRVAAFVDGQREHVAGDLNQKTHEGCVKAVRRAPQILQANLAEVLGLNKGRAPPAPLQRLWGHLFPHAAQVYRGFQAELKANLLALMNHTNTRLSGAILRGLNKFLHWGPDEEIPSSDDDTPHDLAPDGRSNGRFGLQWPQCVRRWIATKIDAAVDQIAVEVKPELRASLQEAITRVRFLVGESLRNVLDWFLPDELKFSRPVADSFRPSDVVPYAVRLAREALEMLVRHCQVELQGTVLNYVYHAELEAVAHLRKSLRQSLAHQIPYGLYSADEP